MKASFYFLYNRFCQSFAQLFKLKYDNFYGCVGTRNKMQKNKKKIIWIVNKNGVTLQPLS